LMMSMYPMSDYEKVVIRGVLSHIFHNKTYCNCFIEQHML
jgi:hypothetical protein